MKRSEIKQPARKPSRTGNKPEKVKRSGFTNRSDITLISGKWIWVHDHSPTPDDFRHSSIRPDLHRFRVKYLTNRGEVKSCLARSSSSQDIKEAMTIIGVADAD